jgi:eukaryotic-like serine/threonine-protein kinase
MTDPAPTDAIRADEFLRARTIFESALQRPQAERRRLVLEACGEDTGLRAAVEHMLDADSAPHRLLDGGLGPADRWRPGDSFAGHFRIIELIGRGGMGEVYRAHDAALGRDVALKVLPSSVVGAAASDDRLARFRREAQVLAALNHPGIASIHGLEEAAGVRALVLELVEGPTLADRIAAGPVPIDDAIGIARQIAVGLEAAHEQGIVHRDLKPANIKLRPDGTAKLLDFGLAKVVLPETSDVATASPTITSPSLVQQGVLLGTAAYMSPEQARGREADRRSDVWAFGAVLYEMLTGSRAFAGVDVADTLAAVLRAGIDWPRLPPSTPEPLRRLLARCLDRDTTRRLRDIGEARVVLEDLQSGALPPPAAADNIRAHGSLWRRVAVPAAAAIVAATAVAVALWPRATAGSAPVTRFALSLPPDSNLLLDPQSRDLAITPDGTRVIYKGGERPDRTRLFQYELDELGPKPLTELGLPKGPFASPDGQWIGFFEPGIGVGALLKKVAATGGPPLLVGRLDGPSRGATWGSDGVIVAASGTPGTGLLSIPAAGGELEVLTRPNREQGEADHLWPQFLPGSQAILFTVTALTGGADASSVAVFGLGTGQWKTVIRGGSQAQYVPSGHLVYVAGGALWAIGFDAARQETVGSAVVVVPQVVTLPTGVAEFDVGRDGTLVYVARGGTSETPRTLVWVDRQGREEPIAAPARAYDSVRLSPDGTRIALEIDEDARDIWVWHLAHRTLTRVTTDPGLDETPVWMPDGRRLVYTSQVGGALGALVSQAADGTGAPQLIAQGERMRRASDVVPDGSAILYSDGTGPRILTLGPNGRSRALVQPTSGGGGSAALSPDGRLIAHVGVDSGAPQVFVSAFPNPGEGRTQVSPDGGSQPRWAPTGRELFYTGTDGALMSVAVAAGETLTVGLPTRVLQPLYYGGLALLSRSGTYDVAPDGRLLMLKQAGGTNQQVEPATVIVVKNWVEELKRVVPVRP